MFPFLVESIYHYRLDQISLLLVPSYVLAATVGALSGKVSKKIGSSNVFK